MSKYSNSNNISKNCSKIIGIQFSILSPDEIRKGSVAEITSRDTYINNKPVIGGLFDPRMGVLEPGLICPTDGLDYMQTPGYAGHIELAKPVFYIQFLTTILKCLKCVCFKCSKLLINKEKYKQALKLQGDARWKYVFALCSKIKRCGEDTEDGCGCLQPNKIRKEGLATIFAEWKNDSENEEPIIIKITPEMVLKIFKRISDEDVSFMGFSPIYSRPDWMVCQTMLVPPPAVRPSVKHDAQQRSEDDLSHILVNIIKTNKTLQDKIQNNAPANVIDDWTTVLQYYVATQVDNKIPGVASVAQRSGRPFKSIKDRLNGKGGRMRGNLMAKRVDYSARSVITADPNISIRELGIPMKIAKNITKPVTVNKLNRDFLTKLVQNGPELWPGAKILEKKNGESITLRYFTDRKSIILEEGDIVHRHMMDGDAVLFNRQPTLHRMSMMCHIARIMKRGDTFRMNVADTKPYNADFDGDEMNLHMPQDPESEAELKNLAAVPYQIISPANNTSIIGIYQDSMLGCYQFSRPDLHFTPREAMNMLMMFNGVNEIELLKNSQNEKGITNFDILTQIMLPLSMKYKTKAFKEDKDDMATSNAVVEIRDGKYIRGQMDKGVLGAGTKGLLQRTCNDFGNMASAKFIDDLQNVVTEYMTKTAFSVGISDLISDTKTNDEIITVITQKKNDVKNLIDQTQIGIFENNTGKTNEEEFETQVNNILNQATSESGKIGLKSLGKNNRFVTMVNAGSKGSDLNISFMISCLGQQNVDGKRIPYGFEHRTLPHFTKYDDSPGARGFVESSYINGLSPQELFFHAMGGRVGLIDTAVKTSTTGYIQRRLIKGLEDLMVGYDMTIRTNKNKIVQFSYGDDNFDTVKVENQMIPIVNMSIQEIYAHYLSPEENNKLKTLSNIFLKNTMTRYKKQHDDYIKKCNEYIEMMVKNRNSIIKNVFKNKGDSVVNLPVAFSHIISNVQGQTNITGNSLVDITPYEAFGMIEQCYANLQKNHYVPPTELFKTLFFYYLSPKDLLIVKRFNNAALTLLLDTITINYKRAIVAPGEMVGMIAGQSIGEVSTQMTLNTFHFAGVASKSNVTRGVPRIEEILSLSSEPKNPSLTIYLKEEDETQKDKAHSIMYMLEHTRLEEVVKSIEICFDPDDLNTLISEDKDTIKQYRAFENMVNECIDQNLANNDSEKSKWIIRMELDPEVMLEKNITMDDINFTLNNCYDNQISCVYSDYNSEKLIFRIRMNEILKSGSSRGGQKKTKVNPLDQSDQIYILKNFQDQLLQNVVLRGIKGINKVILRKIKDNLVENNGVFKKQDIWVLDTIGTNLLDILGVDYIDSSRTFSNDIVEIYNVLGIEAARQVIYNELADVIEFDGTYINYHNYSVLVDRMTFTSKMISIFRHGINNDNIGPIAKASFEETPEMFLKAARHAELDTLKGISANVMCGQEGFFGTSAFQVVLDIEEMYKLQETSEYVPINVDDEIDKFFGSMSINENEPCGINNISIQNNVVSIKPEDLGGDNTYNPGF
uniref:DNA-directed RNA polymerase n=1 Tax=viral metagenome TaxID=1070528 RepID=A0A6C0EPT6_9ZZZZ